MNIDVLQDLKQFISATILQQAVELRGDITSDLREDINSQHNDMRKMNKGLNDKIDDFSQSIADTMDTNNESSEADVKDHEKRVAILEHKAA